MGMEKLRKQVGDGCFGCPHVLKDPFVVSGMHRSTFFCEALGVDVGTVEGRHAEPWKGKVKVAENCPYLEPENLGIEKLRKQVGDNCFGCQHVLLDSETDSRHPAYINTNYFCEATEQVVNSGSSPINHFLYPVPKGGIIGNTKVVNDCPYLEAKV